MEAAMRWWLATVGGNLPIDPMENMARHWHTHLKGSRNMTNEGRAYGAKLKVHWAQSTPHSMLALMMVSNLDKLGRKTYHAILTH